MALEAYERIVRRALVDGESEDELAGRLKTAGVAADQAAAAAAAFQARLPEMRAHMVEATAQVPLPSRARPRSLHSPPASHFAAACCHSAGTARCREFCGLGQVARRRMGHSDGLRGCAHVPLRVQISGPCLVDVDWKVNLSLASSTASSLRKPSVQLALYLEEGCAARKEVLMELDKAQLDLMIDSVSKLRQATDSIPL
jgi:hypothetical protein